LAIKSYNVTSALKKVIYTTKLLVFELIPLYLSVVKVQDSRHG